MTSKLSIIPTFQIVYLYYFLFSRVISSVYRNKIFYIIDGKPQIKILSNTLFTNRSIFIHLCWRTLNVIWWLKGVIFGRCVKKRKITATIIRANKKNYVIGRTKPLFKFNYVQWLPRISARCKRPNALKIDFGLITCLHCVTPKWVSRKFEIATSLKSKLCVKSLWPKIY